MISPDRKCSRRSSIDQFAALPYRIEANGRAQVMLITSRQTRRWVIPKGNPIADLAPHEAAAYEAFEEAGVRGIPCPTPLGHFSYVKKRRVRKDRTLTVEVFPLAFVEQVGEWPERHQRETRWFELADASAAVEEPELKALLLAFREPVIPASLARRALPALWPTQGRKSRWWQGFRRR